MHQRYDCATKTYVHTDEEGIVRGLVPDEPVVTGAATAQDAAQKYLEEHAELLGVEPAALDNLTAARETQPVDAGSEFRIHTEKQQFDTTTVAYDQTYFGLPVWEASVVVHVKDDPYRVIAASSTRHPDLSVKRPPEAALKRFKEIDEKTLASLLGLKPGSKAAKSMKITGTRLVVYQYEAATRQPEAEAPSEDELVPHEPPTLPLPPLPASIEEDGHYVSAVVHFEMGTSRFPTLNWRAIIDVATGAVLHLRPFVDDVNALVFEEDPITTAPSGPPPSATSALLNPKRVKVPLMDLNPPSNGTQMLQGSIVQVSDVESPAVAPPTEPTGLDFDFDARTNDFAATNAYYHCDRFFRLVQGMGFNLASYFGPTPFPSAVDHRGFGGTGNVVNAHCLGLPGGTGISLTSFALADLGDLAHPIGIACDWRVVLHELGGHGILYPHVHSPNFGFSHSAGDSFAAILNDPDSAAADRFVTFPWVNIGRRHDRPVAGGWAWGGVNDVGGYNSEQILCTSHFRIYRSIGGDAALPVGHGYRQFAARFVAYLILRTVGSLTPATNPANPLG